MVIYNNDQGLESFVSFSGIGTGVYTTLLHVGYMSEGPRVGCIG